MGTRLITAPASDPIALYEARAQCHIDSPNEDGLLAGYILAARDAAETYLRRKLVTQTWELTIDGNWPRERTRGQILPLIRLPFPPLQSVTSVTYYDTAGALQTLAANQYRVSTTEYEGTIEPAYGVTWPSVRDQSETIIVRFVCGYAGAIPESVRQALLLTIGHFFEHRESVITGTIASAMPHSAETLLFPYRVFY